MLLDFSVAEGALNQAASCPQDFDLDVKPIEDACRLLDDGLRIVWNPRAKLSRPGTFDVYGNVQPAAYEGRWHVGKKGALDGEFTIIHTLGSELGPERPYRAVGWWLVDFLRQWDTANVETVQKIHEQLDNNDRLDALHAEQRAAATEEATHRYATDTLGMKHWIGTGASFTPVPHTPGV